MLCCYSIIIRYTDVIQKWSQFVTTRTLQLTREGGPPTAKYGFLPGGFITQTHQREHGSLITFYITGFTTVPPCGHSACTHTHTWAHTHMHHKHVCANTAYTGIHPLPPPHTHTHTQELVLLFQVSANCWLSKTCHFLSIPRMKYFIFGLIWP